MEAATTSLRELIDAKLRSGDDPTSLDQIVTELRGEGRSWARTAAAVSLRSGVEVSFESLRRWYGKELAA
jgi:hypothetical protein